MKKVVKLTNVHLKAIDSKITKISCMEIYDDTNRITEYKIVVNDDNYYEGIDKDKANSEYLKLLKKAKDAGCRYRVVKIF